jgi:hypothetical protein
MEDGYTKVRAALPPRQVMPIARTATAYYTGRNDRQSRAVIALGYTADGTGVSSSTPFRACVFDDLGNLVYADSLPGFEKVE